MKKHRILSGTLVALSLLVAVPTWADYVPPVTQPPPATPTTSTETWAYNPGPPSTPITPTINTGSRGGCDGNSEVSLTVLAPKNHVGKTTSTRPTLAWFVPEEQLALLEVSIYKVTETESQLVYKTELTSAPGIMSITLPDDHPGLESGHRYSWQVVLLCNPNRPSNALFTSAELEVVSPSTDLEAQLHQLIETEFSDPNTFYTEQSRLLLRSGLWYDAIAAAFSQSESSRNSTILAILEALARYSESSLSQQDAEQEAVRDALRESSF